MRSCAEPRPKGAVLAAFALVFAGASIAVAAEIAPGATPLLDAAANGDHAAAMRLVSVNGANVNAAAADGSTAIMYAAANGDLELVRALINAGADVKLNNQFGTSAITEAAIIGSAPILDALLKAGADANAEGCHYNGYTALAAAAEQGHADIVEKLLDAGADVLQTSGNKHWTAYQCAYFVGQQEIAERLWRLEKNKAPY